MTESNYFNFSDLPENAPVCIWSHEEGDSDIYRISGGIEFLTGHTIEEIKDLPEKLRSLIHTEDYKTVKEKIYSLKNRAAISIDYRIQTKDNRTIRVAEWISRNGNVLTGILFDVSEYAEREKKQLEEIDILKKKNESKDKFISIISHDLRSPFTSILGFTEILINEPDISEEERNEYLHYVNESSQNLLGLINHLLDWGRIQTGRIQASFSRLNAASIVYDNISSLTGSAVRKNIEIKNISEKNLYVYADESLASKVMMNLLDNAIKFSKPGNEIEVRVNKFNNKKIEFVIKDEGTGIKEEDQAKIAAGKIFSMNGTNEEKGTGIGIPLVKEILKMHNTEMWLYSEEGKGTEVHFTLPSFPSSVLLIDNDLGNKEKVEKIIGEKFPDFNFIYASNFYEAAFIIASTPPSLIIMKHQLDLMNGIEFIKFVKKNFSGYFIPVILLCNPDNEIMSEYYSLNIHSFTEPEIVPELFFEEINSILN